MCMLYTEDQIGMVASKLFSDLDGTVVVKAEHIEILWSKPKRKKNGVTRQVVLNSQCNVKEVGTHFIEPGAGL